MEALAVFEIRECLRIVLGEKEKERRMGDLANEFGSVAAAPITKHHNSVIRPNYTITIGDTPSIPLQIHILQVSWCIVLSSSRQACFASSSYACRVAAVLQWHRRSVEGGLY